ncbi:MAG: hypothetical protein QW594_00055 [Candidatus Woesearchaeota archaeon]
MDTKFTSSVTSMPSSQDPTTTLCIVDRFSSPLSIQDFFFDLQPVKALPNQLEKLLTDEYNKPFYKPFKETYPPAHYYLTGFPVERDQLINFPVANRDAKYAHIYTHNPTFYGHQNLLIDYQLIPLRVHLFPILSDGSSPLASTQTYPFSLLGGSTFLLRDHPFLNAYMGYEYYLHPGFSGADFYHALENQGIQAVPESIVFYGLTYVNSFRYRGFDIIGSVVVHPNEPIGSSALLFSTSVDGFKGAIKTATQQQKVIAPSALLGISFLLHYYTPSSNLEMVLSYKNNPFLRDYLSSS